MPLKTIKQKFVIDESGSMLSQKHTVISGFNEQLQTMRKEEVEKNVRYLVTLTKFAGEAVMVYKDRALAEVPELNNQSYSPCGSTALYDAIGMTIDTAAPGETDCMVTIMTDGEENASRSWKKAAIKALVDLRQKENKWGFVYFGANQDAWKEATNLGVSNAFTYTTANTANAIHTMSAVRSNYVSSSLSGTYTVNNLTSNINAEDLVK